ncbi:MAG TPA: hypothetical protein VMM18_08680 [Gemmatimonadaceae bacterium]|nr:hypothetical protein [Gemmatimonadaceae bacterium]
MRVSARIAAFGLSIVVVAVGVSCGPLRRGADQDAVPLVVRNRSSFDVIVYALPSRAVPESRIRLGRVPALSEDTLLVSSSAMPRRLLTVYLRAAATPHEWISQEVAVSPGTAACLDIQADPSGRLTRSFLYTAPIITAEGAADERQVLLAEAGMCGPPPGEER